MGTTVAAGFIPFLVLSLITDSFWPRSQVAVPLSLSPSILIGDSILIPWFNRYAVPLLWNALTGGLPQTARLRLWLSGITSITGSAALNLYLHILWARDAYTGFIDPTPGKLSLGGKWHCAFASLEMAFVLFFVCACLIFRRDPKRITRPDVLKVWRIFVGYSSLSILDAMVMILIIGRPAAQMSATDFIALLPPFLAAAMYLILSRAIRR